MGNDPESSNLIQTDGSQARTGPDREGMERLKKLAKCSSEPDQGDYWEYCGKCRNNLRIVLAAYALGVSEERARTEQLRQEAAAIWRGFERTSLNGVVCSIPDAGVDSATSRTWCAGCQRLYRRLFKLAWPDNAALSSSAPQEPQKVHHMKQCKGTVCGAARERGNSYYEWAYVNCPDCIATRPSGAPQEREGQAEGKDTV